MEKSNTPTPTADQRESVIVRASVIGIVTNLLLTVFKTAVGIMSNSIAVITDAANNLSDALSSIITIVGTKLAKKLPNKKHPFGYGRIEYLSTLIVAGIVLDAGITAGAESIKKILQPETPDYSTVSLIIIAVAIVVKVLLGKYVSAQGELVNSGSLKASGSDALSDAFLSASVLGSAIVFKLTGLSLEPYVGIIIAGFIVKAGIEMMSETLDSILGARVDKETTNKVKGLLTEEPEVRGAYDLIVHNYGPDKNFASVHLELPDTMTVREADKLTRKLERKVYKGTGIVLTGVGVYSYNTGDDEAAQIQKHVHDRVMAHDWALQLHGFYVDVETKEMTFDVVMSFAIQPKEGIRIIHQEIKEAYPEYDIQISPDVDISD